MPLASECDGCNECKGFARGRHAGRHWRIRVLCRAAAPASTGYRWCVDRQPYRAGTLSSHFHRPDAGVPRTGLPAALSCPTAVRAWRRLPRPASAQAPTRDLLAGRGAAARPVGGALGRTVVLLKGEEYAQIARRRVAHGTVYRIGRESADGRPRRSEHDV